MHHSRIGRDARRRRRRWVTAGVIAAVALATAAIVLWLPTFRLPASGAQANSDWPGWGFTHTQCSADAGEPAAMASAEGVIKSVPMVQAQHIMGFGADNPEPAPGLYDFATLDRRMDLIRRTGGFPVIILCCAPDWMKGGEPGTTDWERLEAAPRPEHFGDFAALSATIAKRYPYVRHFIVWNEFKGFFDDEQKRWDAEEYTDLYNAVYGALKAVNPDNQVGGPYLDFAAPVDSSHRSIYLHGSWGAVDQRVLDAFAYWKLHRTGADFVVVDGHATTGDGVSDEFAAVAKFAAVGAWLRKQVSVPIWWAEWYVDPASATWPPERQIALRVAAMIELASTAPDTVLYWNAGSGGPECPTCLWTDTRMVDGGQPLPFLTDFLQRFVKEFPPNVDRQKVSIADGLLALASPRALLIVNTTDSAISAPVDGRTVQFSAYETRWITAQP